MYLTSRQSSVLSRVMTTLAEPHEEHDIRLRVGEAMLALLDAQHYASYVWDDAQRRFDKGIRINMDPANLMRYDEHYQYHDPITFAMQRHRTAVRATDVLPQPALMRTEFFNDFLARDGLHWGVNLYAWSGDRNIGDMRIWRDRHRDNFTADDMQLLDLVRPALIAALRRCGADDRAVPTADTRHPAGSGAAAVLSARERQVAGLAADGMPDKAIARRLGISVTTVRTHLDHAFRKLDVSNRSALARKIDA
jgi:DNA-binding CsgD family transcriptional regulator